MSDEFSDFNDDYDGYLPEQQHNRWELDHSKDLDEFRLHWSNRIQTEGLEYILSYMRFILNKTNALTNLQEHHIQNLGVNYMQALSDELLLNSRKWQITPEDRFSIISQLSSLTLAQLRKSYKDGERKYRSQAYKVNLDDDDLPRQSTGGGMLDGLRSRINKKPQERINEEYDEDIING